MRCPNCGSEVDQAVEDTRKSPDRVTRRRRCQQCRHSYLTTERLSEAKMQVRKLDGRVEGFSRDAVRRAIKKASVRDIAPDRLDELVDAVATRIQPVSRDGAVGSQIIGDAILDSLRSVDEATHIRFALVHYGRRDRAGEAAGWSDVFEVVRWLRHEYPELQYYDPPARLRTVVKRDGRREEFSRKKLEQSIGYSSKGRGSEQDVYRLAEIVASDVESALADQPMVTSGQIATEILRSLRLRDHVAYLRFASTAKRFTTPHDYAAEATGLQQSFRHQLPAQ